MNRNTVAKVCIGLFILLGGLAGCGEDVNPLLGRWLGTITESQRQGLEMHGILDGDRLELEFSEKTATLNGEIMPVVYQKNGPHHFINETGSNRTMSAIFVDANSMELRISHHFKRRILVFKLVRVPATQ